MIEQVINKRNMQLAYKHVMSNKGSAGVDGMQLKELTTFVKQHRDAIAMALYNGKYLPKPILGVAIPKSNGKTRLLGIPTVVDRWLQQCVTQAITIKFELEFKPNSYGFRHGKLKDLDSWLRNRLRYCIWHDWKKPDRKRKNLMRLGIDLRQAYQWSRTRMGGWRVAQSPILLTTITLKRLEKKGYESLLDYYLKVSPQLNEPLYTRPVRTVV